MFLFLCGRNIRRMFASVVLKQNQGMVKNGVPYLKTLRTGEKRLATYCQWYQLCWPISSSLVSFKVQTLVRSIFMSYFEIGWWIDGWQDKQDWVVCRMYRVSVFFLWLPSYVGNRSECTYGIHHASEYTQAAAHLAILLSRFNTVILGTLHAAAILWVLWRNTDSICWTFSWRSGSYITRRHNTFIQGYKWVLHSVPENTRHIWVLYISVQGKPETKEESLNSGNCLNTYILDLDESYSICVLNNAILLSF